MNAGASTPTAVPPRTFADLGEAIVTMANNPDVGGERDITIGDVLSTVSRRSFGPLLLLVGLFSISPATIVPGLTWIAASLTLLLSTQLALGARHPWLPASLLGAKVSREAIRTTAAGMRGWARRVDRILRPRLLFLSETPFANIAGLAGALAALATIPLGLIPVAPLVPGMAITLIGLGLFARDGLLLLAGNAVMGAALWLAYISFN